MPVARDIVAAFHYVGRLFLHDHAFAVAVVSVFGIAALMLACKADTIFIFATIVLGCLAVAAEFTHKSKH